MLNNKTYLEIGVQSKGVINENALNISYKKIAKSGIKSVDYDITWSNLDEDINYKVYENHRKIADGYGIRFGQAHAPRVFIKKYPEDIKKLVGKIEESMKVCNILGCPYLVVHPIKRFAYMSYEEAWEMNINYFEEIAKIGLKYKVIVCIENVQDRFNGKVVEGICTDADEVVKCIQEIEKRVGKNSIGACFDIGHANILRQDIGKQVKKLGSYLKVLHIHDNNGDSDDHQIPYSFSDPITRKTTTDWSGFLCALRSIDYNGVISFETYAALVAIPVAEQKSLLKYLYKLGCHFDYIISFKYILQEINNKELVLFGSGKMFEAYMSEFGKVFRPSYVIDNNSELWGTEKQGIEIKRPDCIIKDKDEIVVMICNLYYEEIMEQLENMEIDNYIVYEEIYRLDGKP